MQKKFNIIYVGFAFEHHKNTQSGYHHIKDYLHYDRIIDCQREFEFVTRLSRKNLFYRLVYSIYRRILGRGCPLTIIYCILISIFNKNVIFHFVYGENTYKWLHKFKGKSNKIICTYHQPVDRFLKHPEWIKNLPHIDGIILLSLKDVEMFKQWSVGKSVKYIPHGINVDFYSPSEKVEKKNEILMVGNWLRDFRFANAVFLELLQIDNTLTVTVVTNTDNFHFFDKNCRIKLLSGISNEELLNLYRSSSLLFCPLQSYTANNAILEAASVDCQIVIATNQANDSYFSEKQVTLLPLDKEVVVKYLAHSYKEQIVSLREYVIANFSWRSVALETEQFFKQTVI